MLPRVHVNCACSLDGKLACRDRRQLRLSSDEDMARVHRLRASHDAILVGVGTVIADDPKLTVKEKHVPNARQPAAVILDPRGRCPPGALALRNERVFLVMLDDSKPPEAVPPHVKIIRAGKGPELDLAKALGALAEENVTSILAEGGGETIWGLFRAGVVSTMTVYIAPKVVGGRGAPTVCDGEGFLPAGMLQGRLAGMERCGEGVVLSYEF